ncbi:1,3-beta-glucanosyltransferase gas1 [Linnemannia exigua]|uniref:1,3-beta-glucanosyltransferase n=1 Tax=Linnemannia exigua TaxID=604196 RepID=A0AAD4DHN9_9FUNG|nr:1,3-beta-glucanosyltransferase gas1 [Linnemannia exigua]
MFRIAPLPTLMLMIAVALHVANASNPITIKGTKFFDSVTKNQFFINGVAYQPKALTGASMDPLAKPNDCRRDFALMKDLGLNTIRVYQVDPSQNHDECMKALEEVGMYLILDLASPEHAIIRNNPQYDTRMWSHVRKTVDAFKGYSNTLGFFVGNEVTNDSKTTAASAYVKALVRDTKAYIRFSAPRLIPVGYANNDDPEIRLQVQDYFNCGADNERVDFLGINLYEWCGEGTTYHTSGYVDRTADIASYSVPVFLSEYGCNLFSPRTFPEVKAIFGPDMTNTWSGGIAYEWSQEENNYGLVQINNDNSISLLPDFGNLKAALSSVRPTGVYMDTYNEQKPHSTCPAITATWESNANLPLTPSSEVCDCMMSSLACVASEQALSAHDSMGSEFGRLCGITSCEHISTNAKTGVHGKYSFCTPTQKLGFLYNQYYSGIGQSQPSSCHFNGMAVLSNAARSSDEGCTTLQAVKAAGISKREEFVASEAVVSHKERSALGLAAIAALAAFI